MYRRLVLASSQVPALSVAELGAITGARADLGGPAASGCPPLPRLPRLPTARLHQPRRGPCSPKLGADGRTEFPWQGMYRDMKEMSPKDLDLMETAFMGRAYEEPRIVQVSRPCPLPAAQTEPIGGCQRALPARGHPAATPSSRLALQGTFQPSLMFTCLSACAYLGCPDALEGLAGRASRAGRLDIIPSHIGLGRPGASRALGPRGRATRQCGPGLPRFNKDRQTYR